MRILHISDIHAGLKDFSLAYLFDKRIFGRATQCILRSHNISRDTVNGLISRLPEVSPDYVVCTGDLTSIGSPAEFRNALEWLRPIVEFVGKDRFFYVPGNHDAYVPLSDYGEALIQAFGELNNHRLQYTEMPKRLELDGIDLILAGGARPCPIWLSTGDWFREGWQRLEREIASRRIGVPLVLATHFPCLNHLGKQLSWRTRLVGSQKLLDWAKSGRFELQLSGHVHYPFQHKLPENGALLVGAGSLTIRHSYAVIDFDNGGINARLEKF